MKKIIGVLVVAALVLSFPLADADHAWSYTFEELAASYRRADELDTEASVLKSELLDEADSDFKVVNLWRTLWRDDITARESAANALKIIELTFPDGDPEKWDMVSGFLYPSQVPSTLVAVDAVYVASISLIRMDTDGAYRLARNLMNSLMNSSRAKMYFIDTAPDDYNYIAQRLSERGFTPDYGNWPEAKLEGSLPLASPVRGYISSNAANSRGMVFLNGSAEIKNQGYYAWDRKRGRLYKVVERGRRGSGFTFIFGF